MMVWLSMLHIHVLSVVVEGVGRSDEIRRSFVVLISEEYRSIYIIHQKSAIVTDHESVKSVTSTHGNPTSRSIWDR
jgi:hypothetical protein